MTKSLFYYLGRPYLDMTLVQLLLSSGHKTEMHYKLKTITLGACDEDVLTLNQNISKKLISMLSLFYLLYEIDWKTR